MTCVPAKLMTKYLNILLLHKVYFCGTRGLLNLQFICWNYHLIYLNNHINWDNLELLISHKQHDILWVLHKGIKHTPCSFQPDMGRNSFTITSSNFGHLLISWDAKEECRAILINIDKIFRTVGAGGWIFSRIYDNLLKVFILNNACV